MLWLLQAKDRRSGMTVALKLYRMHKLNDISSHQVAREVSTPAGLCFIGWRVCQVI